jgi:hypothetical protein
MIPAHVVVVKSIKNAVGRGGEGLVMLPTRLLEYGFYKIVNRLEYIDGQVLTIIAFYYTFAFST